MSEPSVLILPGLTNSGPGHWQSHWERENPSYRRVQQRDWDRPERAEWVATLTRAIDGSATPVVLVAHSLACALVAHVASNRAAAKVRAALLVAPSDVDSPERTPPEVRSFSPLPLSPLPFRSTVVASTDDPCVSLERARHFARAWGSRLVEIGKAGHINSASGLGAWPDGKRQLEALLQES
ncbi:MAG TPA: alpha/beta hydrolase [Alphaproteobacteria bacterium]|nr:alpha/beta hydrolase [Alphaproteobacteria bacterium]